MKPVRWRYVLPIVQLALAIALLFMADAEQKAYFAEAEAGSGWAIRVVWDYIPSAYGILVLINFPAVVVSAAISDVFAATNRTGFYVFFLSTIALLWYLVGRGLDQRLGYRPREIFSFPRSVATCLFAVGFLGFAALGTMIVVGVATRGTGLGWFPVGGSILWCIALTMYFGVKLARNLRPHKSPAAGLSR